MAVALGIDAELLRASKMWNGGDHQGASTHLERVLCQEPSNAPAVNNGLGLALVVGGQFETGENFLAKAITADDSEDWFWINLLTAQIVAKCFRDSRALVLSAPSGRHEPANDLTERLRKEELSREKNLQL